MQQKWLFILLLNSILFSGFTSMQAQCVTELDFNTWTQEGPAANGDWDVSPDGSTVVQTINGSPTFLVSPDTLANVLIEGQIRVNDSDNDYIGFVFGFQEPSTVIDSFDFILLDWKGGEQVSADCPIYTGREGLSLNRVQGRFTDTGCDYDRYFLGHTNDAYFTVLDSLFGPTQGWTSTVTYYFSILYTADRIVVEIDGVPVFDVEGCFPTGRAGFYNMSQENVTYSDFQYTLSGDIDAPRTVDCATDSISICYASASCALATSNIATFNWTINGAFFSSTSPCFNFSPNVAGEYEIALEIEDLNGCTDLIDVSTVSVISLSADFLSGLDSSFCTNSSAVDLPGLPNGGRYQGPGISDLTFSPELSPTGEPFFISYSFTDSTGCILNDSIETIVHEAPSVEMSVEDSMLCLLDDPLTPSVSPIGGYFSGPGITDHLFLPTQAGTGGPFEVWYVFRDANGCIDSASTDFYVLPSPEPDLGIDYSTCNFETATLNPGNFERYLWSTGSTAPSIEVMSPGRYEVLVSNTEGCSNSASILIADTCQGYLLFPTAFTPTSDGLNDQFGLAWTSGVSFESFDLSIRNRWGNEVFRTQDSFGKWDGTFMGRAAETASYIWTVEYVLELADGNFVSGTSSGSVTLLR